MVMLYFVVEIRFKLQVKDFENGLIEVPIDLVVIMYEEHFINLGADEVTTVLLVNEVNEIVVQNYDEVHVRKVL